MFRTFLKQSFIISLFFCIFCFQNVFSETGGLNDRPVSLVFVCEPPSGADKPRYYKSTSLFFKRLKNKRVQENGTAFFVGYGSFSSELPGEQLNLAAQNGYDLYIFPKTVSENLPTSTNGVLPWIGFLAEKKEAVQSDKNVKSFFKKNKNRKSKTGKLKKSKQRFLNETKESDFENPSSVKKTEQKGIVESNTTESDSSQKEKTKQESVSKDISQTESSGSKSDIKKTKSSERSQKKKKSTGKERTSIKKDSEKKTKSTSTINDSKKKVESSSRRTATSESSEKKVESSKPQETSQTTSARPTTSNDKIRNDSFELIFDSLKFWFSTNTNPIEFPWNGERILFLAGDKTAEEWSSSLSEKTKDITFIRLLDSSQDLRFDDGIYYTGCASSRIPNEVSVLNFFFRGNRLIRLKQESFSLNSDGSGKSWELE
ncbi:hypothetical protein [Leptospira alstonii]|uniref:Lipoprotein n=2 Tax=Leptospira alstonii TaxID=28452 RepID=M6CYJ6_9LEPT|nr:hypothetical protein [Leptospira alstonii]EMJ95576.1 hypothetical protein LEP1GSC194_0871 [Leptospira alstonii serovar Sichuan str. 79601]EQA81355.1 hypothetical protein LEP1GSC193_1899 [Leptospira alstonii serovar Pingchang str. 80-412]